MTNEHKLAFIAGRERYQEQQRQAKLDTEYGKYIRRINALRKRANRQRSLGYINTSGILSREQFRDELARYGSIGRLVRANLGVYNNETASYLVRVMYEKYGIDLSFEEARNLKKLSSAHPAWQKIKEFYDSFGRGLAKGQKDRFAAQEFFGS